jgi:hypothetical protein
MLVPNLVDPATVYPYYTKRGLSLEYLSKCNSQEFRYIDGAGMGYWLTDSSHTPATATIAFYATLQLPIIDVLSLDLPSQANKHLIIIRTAEPKYFLSGYEVSRNYNVIDRSSIDISADPQYTVLIPDSTPKTLEEIFTDILLGTGFSLSYNADDFPVLDVFIDGMSVLDAIDRICSIYGFVWTADNDTVYIQALNFTSSSRSADGGIYSIPAGRINDIRNSLTDPPFASIFINFQKISECLEGPTQYVTERETYSIQGRRVAAYDPYFPAICSQYGEVGNTDDISDRANDIKDNFEAIGLMLGDYAAKHTEEVLSLYPCRSLKRIHGDFGAGPRTIYASLDYPFYKIPDASREDCSAGSGGGAKIFFIVTAAEEAPEGHKYEGNMLLTVTVIIAPCDRTELINTSVEVVDWSSCLANAETPEALVGREGWAFEGAALLEGSSSTTSSDDYYDCHWVLDGLCCP